MTESLGNKTEIILKNMDNMRFEKDREYDLIFSDYVYENTNFEWASKYFKMLKKGGVMIAMSDFHSDYRYRVHMEDVLGATFINDIKWKNEWGNYKKDRFNQCFDSIMIYTNVDSGWKFYPDRIQVPKATAKSKGLNKFGKDTKPATAWIDDIVLTTVANERVKKEDGKLIKWQKPLRLMDRIISPFTDVDDWVLDNFMGSGTLAEWCKINNRNYVGIEFDKEPYKLAVKRLES